MNNDIGIYIHIPFCKSKCFYCDFTSFEDCDEKIDTYINALCTEILKNTEILSRYNIKTIYFGGGTPSYISSKYIVKIMDILKLFIKDISLVEVTIEVNPNSVTLEKIKEYKNAGINRVSLGLQSTHNEILKKIGRAHTYEDFLNSLKILKLNGIDNISVDLMYPLPGLNLKLFTSSLEKLMLQKSIFNINHISIYNLEVHPDTKLEFLLKEGYLKLVSEDEEYEMRNKINEILCKNGYIKYEISNYAMPNFESKHNLTYWNQEMYLGFGAGASSFFDGTRYDNTKNLDLYIQSLEKNNSVITKKEELDKLDLMKEYVILKLRLKDGIIIKDFKKKFNTDLFNLFSKEIKELASKNLLKVTDTSVFLTSRGQEVANIVWEKFI